MTINRKFNSYPRSEKVNALYGASKKYSKQQLSEKIARDIEEFIANGGEIQIIDFGIMNDIEDPKLPKHKQKSGYLAR